MINAVIDGASGVELGEFFNEGGKVLYVINKKGLYQGHWIKTKRGGYLFHQEPQMRGMDIRKFIAWQKLVNEVCE